MTLVLFLECSATRPSSCLGHPRASRAPHFLLKNKSINEGILGASCTELAACARVGLAAGAWLNKPEPLDPGAKRTEPLEVAPHWPKGAVDVVPCDNGCMPCIGME